MKRIILIIVLFFAAAFPAQAGFQEGLAALDRGDYVTAFRELLPVAQAGDPNAQFFIATMYRGVPGVTQNDVEAAKWFKRSAENGNVEAQWTVANLYREGRGVRYDLAEAAIWFRRAADNGHARAQYNIAHMYRNGIGIPKDETEAARWYRRAADQSIAEAQFMLANQYTRGEGVAKDMVQAYMWLTLAEATSNPSSKVHKLVVRDRDIVARTLSQEELLRGKQLAREWAIAHKQNLVLGK
jgi:TPR repeat protein